MSLPANHRLRLPARLDRQRVRRHAPAAVLGVALVVQLVLSVVLTRRTWFEGDALHYLTRRGTIPDASVGLLEPWSGHWQTVPILLYRVLFEIFGMRSYLPYVLAATVLHLVVCVLTYLLLVRLDANRWLAALLAVVMVLYGAGSEVFLLDAPLPLTLALALGLGSVLLLVRGDFDRRAVVVAAVLLVVATMSSGMALPVLVLVATYTWAVKDRVTAVSVVGPAAVLFLVWFVVWGHDGGRISMSGWDYVRIPQFVWTGMTSAMEGLTGVPGSGGPVLLAVIGGVFLVRYVDDELRVLAWCGLLTAVVQMTLTATVSLQYGDGAATYSRYKYLVLVLLVPALALLLTALARAVLAAVPTGLRAGPVVAVGVIVLAVLGNGLLLEHRESEFRAGFTKELKPWTLGLRAAVAEDERILTATPQDPLFAQFDARLMSAPVIVEALPDKQATPQERLDAESEFQVGVGSETYDLINEGELESTSFQQPIAPGRGCASYTATTFSPSLSFPLGDGNEISVLSASTEIHTAVARDGLLSAARTWQVTPGEAVHIASTAVEAVLVVSFDAGGDFTICQG